MIRSTNWKGGKALELSNAGNTLVMPLDFGPRILRAGPKDGPNLLLEIDNEGVCNTFMPDYRLRGGHRIWHAPEHLTRTYQPDNSPPEVVRGKGGKSLTFTASEPVTGIRKSMTVSVSGKGFRLDHALSNTGVWSVPLAPWTLTMFRKGGLGIVPLPPKGSHADGDLLPSLNLVPWSYTDLSLPCWKFHKGFISLDSGLCPSPQKLGLGGYAGWSAYWFEGELFVKYAKVELGATYPDLGCAFETFSNGEMLELETLGPLTQLAPGASVTHTEHWMFFRDVPRPVDDRIFNREVAVRVRAWLKSLGKST
jgi:hypothetical protein